MNQPLPPSPAAGSPTPPKGDGPPKSKHRWLRWVLAGMFLLALLIVFLPNILALRFFRQIFLNLAFSRVNTRATVGDLSLSWFSPISMSDLKLQPENTDRAAVTVPQLVGDLPLWRQVFGHNLGTIRITQPELYVHFNREGTNLTRLIRGMANMSLGNRGANLEISDARILLQGESSSEPWPIEKMNLNLTLTPAGESTSGVPTVHGQHAQLLNEMNLTPEVCNDLLKFITPPLFQATRTSGKVSLELDDFDWPLGKPDAAKVNGRLTLYSVDVVPGPVIQLLNNLFQSRSGSLAMQIAKDDVVSFSMHDGRVYHENLTFRMAAMQVEMLVHSHGSVGLDESLDIFIEFQFPGLETADLTNHPFMKLLSQKPSVHITGTLSQPQWKPEGLASQAVQAGVDLLRQRMEERRQQKAQPAAPSN
jgi:hypothetical protein